MVASAVLGAATGTGMALFVGITLVVYRYYVLKRKSKEWGSLDRTPLPPDHVLMQQKHGKGNYSLIVGQKEFNVQKEQHPIQPPQQPGQSSDPLKNSTSSFNSAGSSTSVSDPHSVACGYAGPIPPLQHQSRSYPGGAPGAGHAVAPPPLCRTPSVSSQGSLDSAGSRQMQGGHRGSSPQIRTFAPDGRTTTGVQHSHPEASHSSSFPLRGGASRRSPSPLRAASLDIRCSSPGTSAGDLRTPSPSQSSLNSLTGSSASSFCNSPVPSSPRIIPGNPTVSQTSGSNISLGRCLSPLLLPGNLRGSCGMSIDSASGVCGGGQIPPASPLGAIQPDLYTRRDVPLFISAGMANSNAVGNPNITPLGRLHFRLKYDFDKSDLVVHLIEAHDLAGSDQGGFNDPYVRISMEPEVDTRKRQTAIHRNDANPFFDQSFKFPVSHDDLQSKTLILQVFDYDRYSRNDVIGEVRMALEEFDVASNIEVWGEIGKNKKPPEDSQELLISLSYLPSAERLTVVLLKAKNLCVKQEKDCTDPFVKVYLLINGKRTKKKKSAVRKSTSNPVWNEALTFGLSSANLQNAAIEVCIMDQGISNSNNPLLGCCVIGPKESGPERDHWNDMAQSPRKAVASWHIMR